MAVPRILELMQMPDGRMGVVLDVPPTGDDPGSVTLWNDAEKRVALKRAAREEREACAKIAEDEGNIPGWTQGHIAARNIADKIRARKS